MEMMILKIEREHDRTLLYGETDDYHIIAPKDVIINLYDIIEYTPDGYNFGFFIKKVL